MLDDSLGILAGIALLTAAGYPLRAWLGRIRIPPAVSLMTLGVLVGPAILDCLPDAYSRHMWVLSKAAFVVLLIRAGLGLSPNALKRILVPALAFGLLPVAAEAGVIFVGARWLLFESNETALLAAFLIAAVSPAVILPTMLDQKDKGRGGPRLVPDRIMGQTVVNALVAQTGILLLLDYMVPASDTHDASNTLMLFPISLGGGLLVGVVVGRLLPWKRIIGERAAPAPPARVWIVVAVTLACGLFVYFGCAYLTLENVFATLGIGVMARRCLDRHEVQLRARLKQVWGVAEILLFANLGMMIDLGSLSSPGLIASLLGLFAVGLALRMGVAALMSRRTALDAGERRYLVLSNLPKATIQAVFGPVVYTRLTAFGSDYSDDGRVLLIMAVLAIVATAPIGAVILDRWGGRLLACSGRSDPDRSIRRQEAP